jgi:multiple sugar transport system ATP-binding protein
VRSPAVFLLDEPLSNLDAKLRSTMRSEITRLHRRLDATFIYVTHDQVEAMTMADRIVVMKDGYIQQVDTPQTLYDHPVNMFVAGFIGAPQMNFLPVTIAEEAGALSAGLGGQRLRLPAPLAGQIRTEHVGRQCVLGLRPENFHETVPADMDPAFTAPVTMDVELAEPMGAEVHLHGAVGGHAIVARVSPRCRARAGSQLTLTADLSMAHLFDKQTERALSA